MEFVKMQGTGNDFVVITVSDWQAFDQYQSRASIICDRHFGIGADGLIGVGQDHEADIFMRIFNSDGSEPEMCGNGIRCVAHYARQKGLISQDGCVVRTLAGNIYPNIIKKEAQWSQVKVDMGEPILDRTRIPMAGEGPVTAFTIEALGRVFTATAVSMGNPHCVIFVDQVDGLPIHVWGPALESHPLFPAKTNVEFIQVVNTRQLIMRVWERGAGITKACGTGACAALVAAVLNGYTDSKATVQLAGGDLLIEWQRENNHIYMTGKAEEVFSGIIHLENII